MRKALIIIAWIIGSVLLMLLLVVLIISTPAGKNIVRKQALQFLRNKLKTEVQIGEIDYALPKMIVLRNVLFLDQKRDTLLVGEELRVDIALLQLLRKTVDVHQIHLHGVSAHIYRHAPDTNFNFTYIINAFAGEPKSPKKPTDSNAPMRFVLDRMRLHDVRFRMDDFTGGLRMAYLVKDLDLTLDKIDPTTTTFQVRRLRGDGIAAYIVQDTSMLPPPPADSTPLRLKLAAREVSLRNVSYVQEQRQSRFFLSLSAARLLVHPDKIDIDRQTISINDFVLMNAKGVVKLGATAAGIAARATDSVIATDPAPAAKWRVTANALALSDIAFDFDNEAAPRQPYGIDYAHLHVRDFGLQASSVRYTTDTISGNLAHLQATEQSGFALRRLRTRFQYHPQGATLEDLLLQTDNSLLQRSLSVRYPSLEALAKNPNLMMLQVNLQNSIIGLRDVLLFAPQLRSQPLIKRYGNGRLQLTALATGSLDLLELGRLRVAGVGQTEIDLRGRLRALADPKRLAYQLQIARIQSSRADLEGLLPAAVRQQVRIPDRFGIVGNVSGTTQTYQPNLTLVSTDGLAFVRGRVDLTPNREQYDLFVRAERLDLGRILRRDTLIGALTGVVQARGRGLDPKTMTATASARVSSIRLMRYAYQGLSLNGHAAAQRAALQLDAKDPNARLHATVTATLFGRYPAVTAHATIDSVDMAALGLYPTELRFRGALFADLPVLNPDYPEGRIAIYSPVIAVNGARYVLDTLLLDTRPSADSGNRLVLQSPFIQATAWGHMPLTRLGNAIHYHIDRHYRLADSVRQADTALATRLKLPAAYDFNIQARVARHPIITSFVPQLRRLDTVSLRAALDQDDLILTLRAPNIEYGNYVVNGLFADVASNADSLFFSAMVGRLVQGATLDFYHTALRGRVHHDSVDARLSIADADSNQRFALSASLQQQSDTQFIHIGEGLVLNYKPWTVLQPNAVALGKGGFYFQNVGISSGPEQLAINSDRPEFGAPFHATITDFLLGNLTEIVSKDTALLANGLLRGTVDVLRLQPTPQLTSDLQIGNLSVLGDTLGDMRLFVKSAEGQTLETDVQITGQGNDVRLTGLYFLKPDAAGNSFSMNLLLNPLRLATFEGLANHAIRNTSGNLLGSVQFQGSVDAPRFNGQIRTDQLTTTVSMLNAPFSLPSETIAFSGQEIGFKDFSILDSAGHTATLNGSIFLRSLYDQRLNLRLEAEKWQPVHSSAADNKLFFGDLLLSTDVTVAGPVKAPDVSGSINILGGTNMTVAIPRSEPGLEDRQGIVAFVNMHSPEEQSVLAPRRPDSTAALKTIVPAGSDINVNVNLSDQASFTVLVDAATGDFLQVKGSTNLNAAVQPDGSIGLTGTYEIVDGMYQLNYNFLRRNFRIQRGSNIVFSGEPTEAEVNLTAVYEATVAPYDLVSRQLQDPGELNYYKQRIPFDVQLKISGRMLQPQITFDIVLPEERNYRVSSEVVDVVRARLNEVRTDVSELNKQVFALIVLNRFVGEDPFQNGAGGGGVEGMARQSASRFVSEQLNRFAGGLVKGLDLTIDLATSEDYTTGARQNRTDLNIGASKRLFNDRLTVTVGNNFQLEGSRNTNQNTSLIPGNLAVDYDLSNDQRYRLRFFRRNQDQGAFEGYIIETGVSFILQVDYNRFRQIFMSRRRMEQIRQDRRKKKEERERQQAARQAMLPDNRSLNRSHQR